MGNKVIIDDIDVSECDNLAILQDRMTDKEFTFCNAYQEDCSERENCHYKQLQRLKHQYADVLKLAKENADSNEYCLQELEQENERLKEEKGGMQILIDNYIALTEKYHQTLQEIRDIAEKMYNTNDEDTERDLHIELQAKINEVIGAE